MKTKLFTLTLAFSACASAAVTIQGSFGDLRTSSGALVANGTAFALIGFAGPNFAGNFTVNTSLGKAGADSVFTTGQTLALNGLLGGGTIFAIGGTGGPTAEVVLSGLDNSGNIASGNSYAIYWFPGVTYLDGASSFNVGGQVGGYSSSTGAPNFALDGMVIPPNGQDVVQGFATISGGGPTANSVANAVILIPEPSAALLGAIGALGLLRRRRN